jgi:hypothetical protein
MMNLFSFEVIYKKGTKRLLTSYPEMPSIPLTLTSVLMLENKTRTTSYAAFDFYLLNKVLPENHQLAQLVYKMSQDCFVLDGVVWKRLGANQQHRSVLLVPQLLIPEILHEAHGHLLAGHFGVTKTKQRLLQSY